MRPTLTVKLASIRHAPKMDAFRRPYFSNRFTGKLPMRDVLLLQLRWRVNTLFGETNHSIYSIFWRYWGKALSPNLARLFIEKKPEYFAQGYAGAFAPNALRRQYPEDPDLPPQLCATHPGVVDYFAREAEQVYLGNKVAGGYGNHILKMPGQPWFYPIQEDDSSCWCRCDRCLARFSELPPERRYGYLHFDWVNRIAEAAAQRHPDIGISTLATRTRCRTPTPRYLPFDRMWQCSSASESSHGTIPASTLCSMAPTRTGLRTKSPIVHYFCGYSCCARPGTQSSSTNMTSSSRCCIPGTRADFSRSLLRTEFAAGLARSIPPSICWRPT